MKPKHEYYRKKTFLKISAILIKLEMNTFDSEFNKTRQVHYDKLCFEIKLILGQISFKN